MAQKLDNAGMDSDTLLFLLMQSLPTGLAGPVGLVLRENGKSAHSFWCDTKDSTEGNLRDALAQAETYIGAATVLEVNAAYDMKPMEVPPSQVGAIYRGLRGVRFHYESEGGARVTQTLSPTTMIARNLGFGRAAQKFVQTIQSQGQGFDASRLRVEWFDSHQLLYLPERGVVSMYRGNEIVPPEAAGRMGAQTLAEGMGDWLRRHTADNGRITYKYWPSRGEESDAVNLIRLFMAVLCLFRMARREQCEKTMLQARVALRYHLSRFYGEEGSLGYVLEEGKVKLGACALAALCIEESGDPEGYAKERAGLAAMVDHLWQTDGSFRTFYKPQERTDCQNFYPGEALLYWATRWVACRDEALLQRIVASFDYYRAWHLENRNPAFIPWHTQAYFLLWQHTQDADLRDFIFEMNDWLLPIQQWDTLEHPDERGRFYDPDRPFGPPHASSTGVYLEGLVDAWQLARAVNDSARAHAYEQSIRRAIRSLMQLQFKDEVDMFYISRRQRVLGALRTTCYHNEIRVDNVQHGLMGLMKLLETDWR